MAKETVGVEVDVQYQTVGNLKKEIRAATADVIAMQEKFGEASKEAIAAAKRVNELKDKIKDAKEVTDLFDPGNKFKALGNAVAGVASGFTAVQGAMGLFGAESKELEKQLLKVQSAMALSQGLSAFLDSGKDFKRLSAIIQSSSVVLKLNAAASNFASGAMKMFGVSVNTTSNAFKVLKGAIVATGIGVLVVVLGELVSLLMDVASSSDEAAKAQKRLEKAEKDAAEAIALQNRMLEEQIDVIKRNTEVSVKRAKAAGANEHEITKITRDGILQRKKLLEDDLMNRSTDDSEYFKKLAELRKVNNELEDFDLDQQVKRTEKSIQDNKAKNDKIAAQNKEKREKERQEQLDFEQQQRDDWEAAAQEEIRLDAERIAQEELNQSRADELKFGDLETSKQVTKELINLQHGLTEAQRAAADARRDIRFAELDLVAQFGGVLKELAGKNKALLAVGVIAENAAAIGKIVMNTQVANAKAAAQFPLTAGQPWVTINTISGALGVASSILAAKRSLTNLGGGSVSGGMPSMNTKAPMTPTLSPTVQTNVQNAQAINQMSSQSTRAYVLNSDIQNEQQRNAYLQRNASI
jgi:hypothetical protein